MSANQSTEVTAKVETITPDIASAMLGMNVNNRNLRKRKVTEFAGAISRGEWMLNGESIKIDADGKLIDGQHRLHAVVESGIPVEMLVIRGLDAVAQTTMDTGTKRTFSDTLKWAGESNTGELSSTLRVLRNFADTGQLTASSQSNGYTKNQLLDMLKKHPDIRDASNVGKSVKRLLTPSLACTLYYLFNYVDPDDAELFFRKLGTGENIAQGDPIFALRQNLLSGQTRRSGGITPRYRAAITIKAFNAWRKGEQLNRIMWRAGGAKAEKFPEIEELKWEA